nr:hypothetical protein [Pseudonocardia sp. DSM 110487]
MRQSGVMTVRGLEYDTVVTDGASHQSDVVKGWRQREHSGLIDAAPCRFETDDAGPRTQWLAFLSALKHGEFDPG